jgi:hypothetical protein
MARTLTPDFIEELLKSCLKNRGVLDICRAHLQFQYLADENQKKVWKAIVNHADVTGTPPSIGMLGEKFHHDRKVMEVLAGIKAAELPDNEALLFQLESYLKQAMFVEYYDTLAEMWNTGKQDDALAFMEKRSKEINDFTIKGKAFINVFSGYTDRMKAKIMRQIDTPSHLKAVTGIPELDEHMGGGLMEGDTLCFLARSGIGKTKCLRWMAVANARRGLRVLHIQLEGTEQKAIDGYDATWQGVSTHAVEQCEFSDKRIAEFENAARSVAGEIHVVAFEKFGQASMADVRQAFIDCEKAHGKVDLVVMDYLEKCSPANKIKYTADQERHRRAAIADDFKNLCTEGKTRGATATQAEGVRMDKWNKADFFMTRENVSECKMLPNSFSFFLTMNQTIDEKENKFMRIYEDKMRDYVGGALVGIYQAYAHERFYDHQTTTNHLLEMRQFAAA